MSRQLERWSPTSSRHSTRSMSMRCCSGWLTTHKVSTKSHAAGFAATQTSAPTFDSWCSVSSVRTEATDVSERLFGDVGVVTCWLDQTYTLDGREQSVSAPTTMVFRNEGGDWKLSLFHSVPLPQQE